MDRTNTGGSPSSGAAPRKKKKKKKSIPLIILSIFGKILLVIFTIALIGVLTVAIFAQFFMSYANTVLIPSLDDIRAEEMTMSLASTVYCKNPDYVEGESPESEEWLPLRVIHTTESNRVLIEYDDLPDHLIKALVAIEDKRFWDHHGVDWRGTARAIIYTLTGHDTQGGSTITQQVLRNITDDREVTVLRKFREIFRALEFEKSTSKEDILTLYLNRVTFGHAQGIGMAAKVYFGKEVNDLDLAESASLIAITNNPSLYDPFFDIEYVQSDGSVKTPRDFNKKRQTDILWELWDQGIISEEEYLSAREEFLMFTDTDEYKALHAGDSADENETNSDGETEETVSQETENGVLALHTGTYTWFEDAVIEDAIGLIMEAQGISRQAATDKVYGGGYHIYTTLDLDIQDVVDSVYEDPSNFDYPSASGQPLASAITITDPYTGDVLAMSGGVGQKLGNRLQNLSRVRRQCGSSIKPVAVYGPAIDADLITPMTVIDDYPVGLNESGTDGTPRNDDHEYDGLMTVQDGVRHSRNAVSVRTLRMLGYANSFNFMEENLGFDLDVGDIAEAPLAMGALTYGVTTEEMAAAYGAFANEGIYSSPRTILRIESNDHQEVIVDNTTPDSRVAMKKTTAYLINNILHRAATIGTGAGANFDGMTIAGKTGTTGDNHDRYFAGYTPYYSAAVWVGYTERSERVQANRNPAMAVWRLVMQQIHEGLENKSFFDKPDGITTVKVCADCGKLATELCGQDYRGSRVVSGEIQASAAPTELCTCHVEVRICTLPDTGEIHVAGPYCPEETVTTRVMIQGREYLMISESITNEDGTVTPGQYVHAGDDAAHLTWLAMQGACPLHDELFAAENPENPDDPNAPTEDTENPEGEPLPGDPGYVPPDWMWGEEGDDPGESGETGGEGEEQPDPGEDAGGNPDEPEDPDIEEPGEPDAPG